MTSVVELLPENDPKDTQVEIQLRFEPSDRRLAQSLEQNPFPTVGRAAHKLAGSIMTMKSMLLSIVLLPLVLLLTAVVAEDWHWFQYEGQVYFDYVGFFPAEITGQFAIDTEAVFIGTYPSGRVGKFQSGIKVRMDGEVGCLGNNGKWADLYVENDESHETLEGDYLLAIDGVSSDTFDCDEDPLLDDGYLHLIFDPDSWDTDTEVPTTLPTDVIKDGSYIRVYKMNMSDSTAKITAIAAIHGDCEYTTESGFECTCEEGWTGERCDEECQEENWSCGGGLGRCCEGYVCRRPPDGDTKVCIAPTCVGANERCGGLGRPCCEGFTCLRDGHGPRLCL